MSDFIKCDSCQDQYYEGDMIETYINGEKIYYCPSCWKITLDNED